MNQHQPYLQTTLRSRARPETIYDLLADLRSHLEWGGKRQTRVFRLASLDAPSEPAVIGTTFSSTGVLPMSVRRWRDHSTVSAADRPHRFEITTKASNGERRTMSAIYRHRYDIAGEDGGSRVTYTLTQLELARPMLRWAIPGMSRMTWLMTPMFTTRGVRNLLAMAEERERHTPRTNPSGVVAGG